MKKWIYHSLKKSFLKPGSNKVYWEKIISGFVVWTGLIIFIIYSEGERNKKAALRHNSPRYTIGIVTSRTKGISFLYYVLNREYNGVGPRDYGNRNVIGVRYIVMYYSKDPSNAEILLNCPVPDSIEGIPGGGWKQLPFKCK